MSYANKWGYPSSGAAAAGGGAASGPGAWIPFTGMTAANHSGQQNFITSVSYDSGTEILTLDGVDYTATHINTGNGQDYWLAGTDTNEDPIAEWAAKDTPEHWQLQVRFVGLVGFDDVTGEPAFFTTLGRTGSQVAYGVINAMDASADLGLTPLDNTGFAKNPDAATAGQKVVITGMEPDDTFRGGVTIRGFDDTDGTTLKGSHHQQQVADIWWSHIGTTAFLRFGFGQWTGSGTGSPATDPQCQIHYRLVKIAP